MDMQMDTHATASKTRFLRRIAASALVALLASGSALADELAPGEFQWTPELAPSGPMVIVVSLPEQRAHVYRNGVRIGVSTISSGKPGNETPTGVFTILEKKRMHHSNLYNNAPMPFMQRLTWDGIALHAGRIPGQPASHGCVRLPLAFSEHLFEATEREMTVVIADDASYDSSVVYPGDAVPVNYITGLSLQSPPMPTQGTMVHALAEY